jgi:hypothetical protein
VTSFTNTQVADWSLHLLQDYRLARPWMAQCEDLPCFAPRTTTSDRCQQKWSFCRYCMVGRCFSTATKPSSSCNVTSRLHEMRECLGTRLPNVGYLANQIQEYFGTIVSCDRCLSCFHPCLRTIVRHGAPPHVHSHQWSSMLPVFVMNISFHIVSARYCP